MTGLNACKRYQGGFSLPEVLVVVAVGAIVTTAGLPRMTNVIANMKLRSSMTTVSGLLQNTRMTAVQQNKTMTAKHIIMPSPPYSWVYYIKGVTGSSSLLKSDPQVELEAPITPYDTPTGTGAPSAITNAELGLAVDPDTSDPSFNSRGLPCLYSGGSCLNKPFIKYFKDDRTEGSGGWAAISITPAGRIKRWFWNGMSWAG